jgi:AcrR family transcriptional regulator
MSDDTAAIVDQTGRVLGPRARATRQRLLDSTAERLAAGSLRELRVADVARAIGTSPATFYQYFKDVEDAVLCLAEQATDAMPAIVELIDGDWRGAGGLDRARRIADAFIRHWDEHRAALRVRNTASDEGDMRFQAVRQRAMQPVLAALARQIDACRPAAAAQGEEPLAAAAALAAILERLAAYHTELEAFGVTRGQLVETTARIVHRTVTGGAAA